MIGGLLKSASTLALIAVASVTLGTTGANAADLGGNCCADLEERVAELEATTARKGNRKVKLTVSGQVNEAVLFWDDGDERNAYVVSNNAGRTRFRFVGDAKINADWSAGYLLEIGVRYANSANRTQFSPNAGGDTNTLDIRHSAWYLNSKTFGRVWVGQTSSATDGITEINLANTLIGGPDFAFGATGGSFRFRRTGATGQAGLSNGQGGGTALTVGNLAGSQIGGNANTGEGDRNNVVKYVSPTFVGFTVQAAWGEDDLADVALRYAGEFGAFRVAAGIGYRMHRDFNAAADGVGTGCANLAGNGNALNVNANESATDCDQFGLSASVMHTPTGLFVSGSYGQANDDNRKRRFQIDGATNLSAVDDEERHYYITAGIEQNWTGLGKTTLYGEYYKGEFGAAVANGAALVVGTADPVNSFGPLAARVSGYDLSAWGVGVTQSIDAAAMDLYFNYRNYSHDVTLANVAFTETRKARIEDSQFVTVGGIIRF